MASLRGGQEYRGWDEGRYMAKAQIDMTKLLQYILVMVHRDSKKRQPDPPQWYPDPAERIKLAEIKHLERINPKPGTFAHMVKMAKEAKRKAQAESGVA